ncbi:MAG: hypothetical protein H7039_17405 [Bryobacteraceae bacterium]|nr:hypothetical protein [Bryobacteraceae bacterium]
MISAARLIAFRVLERVSEGAYASDLLLRETAHVDSRDAGLASEIVYGCLRRQLQLDWLIDQQTGGKRLDPAVRTALRIGLYQLVYLERIPPHAAVGESVELVKAAKKVSAGGLVNAVLRRLSRVEEPLAWPSRSVALSMPAWLLQRWDHQFGPDVAEAIAKSFLEVPETWVRNPPADAAGVEIEAAPDVPGAYRVISGDSRGLRIQDVGSQSIVPLLQLRAGLSFLDLCAAPGNKTAQAMETGVTGIACDVHLHRLKGMNGDGCRRVVLDASVGLPFHQLFDRILVDAPCSGTGTLGRNPEIRWKLELSDIQELQAKQKRILSNALAQLKPEGLLVYSTCSLEREENEDVVEAMPNASIVSQHRRTPGLQAGDGFFAAVLQAKPSAAEPDGIAPN